MIPQDLNEGAKGRYIYLNTGRYRSRWMQDLWSSIKDRIALPGTHDSGTYSLTRDGGISHDAPPLIWNAVGTPGLESRVYDWALTHNLSIAAQLESGIRYLDIRLLDNRQTEPLQQKKTIRDADRERQLFVVHSKFGARIEVILEQIETFLRASTREIVVLRMGTNCSAVLTDVGKRFLVNELLRRRLGDLLAPRTLGPRVCQSAHSAAAPAHAFLQQDHPW